MSIPLTINGVTYNYPTNGDFDWANSASSWAGAVTGGMLQRAGGAFTLQSEVDFGPTFGIKSAYYKTQTPNVSATGSIRLANNVDGISWRNAANTSDLLLRVNGLNQLEFNGVPFSAGSVTSVGVASGDMTVSGSPITSSGTITLTLATVNTNVGSFGTGSQVATITVNGKGLITAAGNTPIQIGQS